MHSVQPQTHCHANPCLSDAELTISCKWASTMHAQVQLTNLWPCSFRSMLSALTSIPVWPDCLFIVEALRGLSLSETCCANGTLLYLAVRDRAELTRMMVPTEYRGAEKTCVACVLCPKHAPRPALDNTTKLWQNSPASGQSFARHFKGL